MYGPRPIRFLAHWCADYSEYRGFLSGGISTASSQLPFFGTRLRRQNFNRTHTIPPATQAIFTPDDVVSQRLKLGSAFLSFPWESKIALFF